VGHVCEDSDYITMKNLGKQGCSCGNCGYHDDERDRCGHPDNPEPEAIADPSGLCIGWTD